MSPTSKDLIKPAVVQLQAYDPHKRPGHVKLDANEHPCALPALVREAVLRALAEVPINRYPDPEAEGLRRTLADRLGIVPDMVLLGNGSDELVQMVLMACGTPGAVVLIPTPTFSMYRIGALMLDQRPVEVPLTTEWGLDLPRMLAAIEGERPRVTFVATPNNPTANCFDDEAVRQLIEAAPGVIVIDEAYHEFSGQTLLPLLRTSPHLIIFRTLSKVGMAGLRVGILVGNPELVRDINKVRLPYNLNAYSQVAAEVVLQHWELIAPEFRLIIRERERLRQGLGRIPGLTVFPSQANFLLTRIAGGGVKIWEALGEQGILVRHFPTSPALADCLRITVGTPAENDLLTSAVQASVTAWQPLIET
ncbi:MAG TPA: histidinol-phosphate transaminase [Candidatus Tectomicrobia bacterium]|nr:histidinol-phosphate transaminase [Candidatus Tectomicrobia bacterium]